MILTLRDSILSCTAFLLFVLSVPLALQAAENDHATNTPESTMERVTLEPVVVTARGYELSLSETPGSVGVVTAEDITLAPKASIVDSLEKIPGINRSGASPWGQDISIRGLSGPSVVVLLNGKRINTATDVNARLGFINPMDIERVEVLKGPVSALYGSGSTGGVINIITRKARYTGKGTETHGRLAISGDTNPAGVDGYANASVSGETAWVLFSVAGREHDDTYGGGHEKVFNSSYSDAQGRMAIGMGPFERLDINLEAIISEGNDIGIPGGPSTMPAIGKVTYPRTGFTFVSLDASYETDGDWLKLLEGNMYYTTNDRRVRVENTPFPVGQIRPSADHDTYGGKVQGNIEIGDHTIVTGVDGWSWTFETARSRDNLATHRKIIDTTAPDSRQSSIGAYAEDNWKLSDKLTLNIGARIDYITTENDKYYNVAMNNARTKLYDAGSENDIGWHLHAGLTWKMDDEWSQSALISSSYRAADLLERFKYINLGGGVELYGNPGLDPEQTIYLEYGLHFNNQSDFSADARIFGNIITDYIAEKQESPSRITMQNVKEAQIYGAELEARWGFVQNWTLFGNVTGLYGYDSEKAQPLPNIAPVTGTVGVDFKHPSGFWVRLDTVMTAPQNSTPEGVNSSTGYMTLNTALGYDFQTSGLKHSISLVVDNILDARYSNYLAHIRGYDVWESGISAMLNYTLEF